MEKDQIREHLNKMDIHRSPLAFYDRMTGLVDEGKAVDSVHPYFSNAFDTVSCSILTDKLKRYWLGKSGELKTV